MSKAESTKESRGSMRWPEILHPCGWYTQDLPECVQVCMPARLPLLLHA